MDNIITWFEIPAVNFNRAVSFYKKIMGIEIQETDMFGSRMGFFPSNDKHVSGAIIQGEGYKPTTDGILIYINGGKDLQIILDKVKEENGTIIVPKTQINPETGFFGIFIDSEGNKMAVHSRN